jgi:hypothetical protein
MRFFGRKLSMVWWVEPGEDTERRKLCTHCELLVIDGLHFRLLVGEEFRSVLGRG